METTQESAIAALWREAEAAHGAYESDVLGGLFDDAWSVWYARCLLDHGLANHRPNFGSLNARILTAVLTRRATEYVQEETPRPWSDVYARGIISALTPSSDSPPLQTR